ncbi:hypothetical protein NHP164001_13580 [Helicobacter trogontum]|uniref:Uncharacterized protein n=1 Tax=Helicobacter trogontum TaxID=50960 RepID=A0ABQ0D4R1_9HELI
MIIFSSFDNDAKFIEVNCLSDCDYLEANCYALICVDNGAKYSLESYFTLAKELHKHNIPYAVLLDEYAKLRYNHYGYPPKLILGSSAHQSQDKHCPTSSPLPLNTLLFMFAKHGANFFILDKRNYEFLPMTQTLINHYLLDIKLLGLVDSYIELEDITSWIPQLEGNNYGQYIGIDGIVEKTLLVFKNKI